MSVSGPVRMHLHNMCIELNDWSIRFEQGVKYSSTSCSLHIVAINRIAWEEAAAGECYSIIEYATVEKNCSYSSFYAARKGGEVRGGVVWDHLLQIFQMTEHFSSRYDHPQLNGKSIIANRKHSHSQSTWIDGYNVVTCMVMTSENPLSPKTYCTAII